MTLLFRAVISLLYMPCFNQALNMLSKGKEAVNETELVAINEGIIDFADALFKNLERKRLLCAIFMNTNTTSISNLYTNVILTKDSCDWGLIFYRGISKNVCNLPWIRPNLVLCKDHPREIGDKEESTIPKSLLYAHLLPLLPKYDRVILLDEDVSLENFNFKNFLGLWACAFRFQSHPLIVQPLINEATQYFDFLRANDWASYKKAGVVASSTHYIEQQVPAFDSRFLEWYIKRVIGRVMSSGFNLEVDWGFDRTWCNAARAYSQDVLGWKKDDVVCALLVGADAVHYHNSLTMSKRYIDPTGFRNHTYKSIEAYAKIFPSWTLRNVNEHGPLHPIYTGQYVRAFGLDETCMAATLKPNKGFAKSTTPLLGIVQESTAISEGIVDFAKDPTANSLRKKLLCAMFLSSEGSAVSNLFLNVMSVGDSCDWGLVFYGGKSKHLCNQEWIKWRLALCVTHTREIDANKTMPSSILSDYLLEVLPSYERVILLEEDMSLKGFDVTKFLSVWSCAFRSQSAPLIVQPLVKGSSLFFDFLHADNWAKHKKDGIIASPTNYVEQHIAALDSRFLEWYIRRVIRRVVAGGFDLEVDVGFDRTWCNAARAYSQDVLGWKKDDVACALLIGTDAVHHHNFHSSARRRISASEIHNLTSLSIEAYRSLFPSWTMHKIGDQSPLRPQYKNEYIHATGLYETCMAKYIKSSGLHARNSTTRYKPQEAQAVEIGLTEFAKTLKENPVTRKKLLCVMFVNTNVSTLSNVKLNVIAAGGSCDWALIFYEGGNMCGLTWIKSRLVMCKSHPQDKNKREEKAVPSSALYSHLLPILPAYERVFLLDDDILLQDFDMAKFFNLWSCAFPSQSHPLIVQPLINEATQYFDFLRADDWASYKKAGVVASSTHYIEQQVPAFDSRFLEWYIKRVIGRVMSSGFNLEVDWGFDRTWCNAARAYSQDVLGWKKDDVVCALLVGADAVHHHHNKIARKTPKDQSTESIEAYAKIFPSWTVSNIGQYSPVRPQFKNDFVRAIGPNDNCTR